MKLFLNINEKKISQIKKFLKYLKDYNGIIGVFIAAWALYFSYSSSSFQNTYNTEMINNLDSLRILTKEMYHQKNEVEKPIIQLTKLDLFKKKEAMDDSIRIVKLNYEIKNTGIRKAYNINTEISIWSRYHFIGQKVNRKYEFIDSNGTNAFNFFNFQYNNSDGYIYVYIIISWEDNLLSTKHTRDFRIIFKESDNDKYNMDIVDIENNKKFDTLRFDVKFWDKYPKKYEYLYEKWHLKSHWIN